jgi:hypothetical protein
MPNPLVDELSPDAKAELAAIFADMRKRCDAMWTPPAAQVKPWWQNRRGW